MMKPILLPLSLLLPLASAHFDLIYPPPRGEDADKMPTFPCGEFTVSDERTQISLSSPTLPIELDMGHDQTAVQILLGVGNDPGDDFNVTLRKTFRVEGLGEFCVPEIELSEELLGTELVEGLNFTVQVVTNGHPSGGLFACADLQLTNDPITTDEPSCTNNTGITAMEFEGAAADRNANVSTADGEAQSEEDGHDHDHGSGDNDTSTETEDADSPTSTDAASAIQTAAWGVLGAAVVGGLAVL